MNPITGSSETSESYSIAAVSLRIIQNGEYENYITEIYCVMVFGM